MGFFGILLCILTRASPRRHEGTKPSFPPLCLCSFVVNLLSSRGLHQEGTKPSFPSLCLCSFVVNLLCILTGASPRRHEGTKPSFPSLCLCSFVVNLLSQRGLHHEDTKSQSRPFLLCVFVPLWLIFYLNGGSPRRHEGTKTFFPSLCLCSFVVNLLSQRWLTTKTRRHKAVLSFFVSLFLCGKSSMYPHEGFTTKTRRHRDIHYPSIIPRQSTIND